MMKRANVNSWKMFAKRIPCGAVAIDTVKTDKYPIGCVLIQYKQTGVYALLSGDVVSTCDQKEANQYHMDINAVSKETTNLRKIRERNEMTQAKLSKLSGVNLRTVKAYDSGERDINGASCGTVKYIADVLGCQIEDLMEIPTEEKTVWFIVIDDNTDRGAAIYTDCFKSFEEAKEYADNTYDHLTGEEIRHRNGLYVLKTTEKDSFDGDVVYRLI